MRYLLALALILTGCVSPVDQKGSYDDRFFKIIEKL